MSLPDSCGCVSYCGDDGDIDGPGTCKVLPLPPRPPLVEIVMVPRRQRAAISVADGSSEERA